MLVNIKEEVLSGDVEKLDLSIPSPIDAIAMSKSNGTNLPLNSPDYTESEQIIVDKNSVCNILPLYQMYTSIVGRSLSLSEDVNTTIPPMYDDTSTISSGPSVEGSANELSFGQRPDSLSTHSLTGSISNNNPEGFIVANEATGHWQNTILDNIPKLKNLTSSTTNEYSNSIKMEIFFTKEVGQLGIKPTFIDILKYEYKQGDLINGYILVENTSDKPIPFDMFYVLFEGNFIVSKLVTGPDGNRKVKHSRKFLEMFDLSASWHPGKIDRLETEYENPHFSALEYDPLDNTIASFGMERLIKPKTIHKRFFTFKIPEKLLDSSCEHDLAGHVDLPPTTGFTTSGNVMEKFDSLSPRVADFAFVGTSVSYSFDARFIGKASMYGEKKNFKRFDDDLTVINSGGDEFLILKDLKKNLRIVQESTKFENMAAKLNKYRYDKLMYENLNQRVDEQISLVEEQLKSSDTSMNGRRSSFLSTFSSPVTPGSLITPVSSTSSSVTANEILKCRQLYNPNKASRNKQTSDLFLHNESSQYKLFYPMQKKSLTGSVKYFGTMVASTTKIPHTINYIAPESFRLGQIPNDNPWKISVPIDLEYVLLESIVEPAKLPEIEKVHVELIACTVKSDKKPIPIEFNHDMFFETNTVLDKPFNLMYNYILNPFESNIVKPFKKKISKLQQLSRKLGNSFRMDAKLVSDAKSMCSLESKNIILVVDSVEASDASAHHKIEAVSDIPWILKNESAKPITYKKSIVLNLDLTTSRVKSDPMTNRKSYDNYCLVPSFQLCNMLRYYYLRVVITLQKGKSYS